MPNSTGALADTGPLGALFDRDDRHHARCVAALRAVREPLITVWPVLTEAMYLLGFSHRAQEDLWEFMERGGLRTADLTAGDVPRIRALMRKYRDRPMDLADAALVCLAERDRPRTVFTLDHADFRIYRPAPGKSFSLIPATLA